MGCCCSSPDRVKLAGEKKETNKQKGQNGQRVKMGICYLPPEKVKMGAAAVILLTESN